jgi:hypothetical protein
MYVFDTPNAMDDPDLEGQNIDWYSRSKLFEESKTVDLLGNIYHPLCSLDKIYPQFCWNNNFTDPNQSKLKLVFPAGMASNFTSVLVNGYFALVDFNISLCPSIIPGYLSTFLLSRYDNLVYQCSWDKTLV